MLSLSKTAGRFDSITEAVDAGDIQAARKAVLENMETIGSVLRNCDFLIKRYRPQLLDLIEDLRKLEEEHGRDHE